MIIPLENVLAAAFVEKQKSNMELKITYRQFQSYADGIMRKLWVSKKKSAIISTSRNEVFSTLSIYCEYFAGKEEKNEFYFVLNKVNPDNKIRDELRDKFVKFLPTDVLKLYRNRELLELLGINK
jgi:hypothetical protein